MFDDQWIRKVHRAGILEAEDEYYTISSRSPAHECLSSLLCLFFSYLVNLAAGRFTVVLDYIPSTVTLLDDLPILIGPYQLCLRSPCYPRRRLSTCPSQTTMSRCIAEASPLDNLDNLFPQHSVCAWSALHHPSSPILKQLPSRPSVFIVAKLQASAWSSWGESHQQVLHASNSIRREGDIARYPRLRNNDPQTLMVRQRCTIGQDPGPRVGGIMTTVASLCCMFWSNPHILPLVRAG